MTLSNMINGLVATDCMGIQRSGEEEVETRKLEYELKRR